LYDLGVPPKRLKLGVITMMAYKFYEKIAKHYIPKVDGRIVINEKIIDYYAPDKDYLLIDGGINKAVVNHLFPLIPSQTNTYVFVCAGMLWDQNGTKLILEAMKLLKLPNIKVLFAGRGNDVPLIEEAAKKDDRIEYLGMLSMDKLFEFYEKADVLLNLRIEEEVDFHFPSKLLEYMATGKTVVSTSIAHAERDYGEYIEILKDVSGKGLASMFENICKTPKQQLFEKGKKMRDFMLSKRTWGYRTSEILNYMGLDE
jgi:glycosyltransferase involved in cell wall biosynthesis